MAPGLQVICVTRSGDQRGGGGEEEEEERGGGDISTRSKRCASHTPIYSLSSPLPATANTPSPPAASAGIAFCDTKKRGRPKRSYSHEYE